MWLSKKCLKLAYVMMWCVFIQQRIILYWRYHAILDGCNWISDDSLGEKLHDAAWEKIPLWQLRREALRLRLKPVGFFHCDTRHQSLGHLFLQKRIGLQFCSYVCCVLPHDELIPSRLGDSHRGSIQSQSCPPYARPFWSKAPWDWRNVICERCWSRRFCRLWFRYIFFWTTPDYFLTGAMTCFMWPLFGSILNLCTWCPCWQSDFGPPIAQRQTMMEMDLWCLLEFSV